MGWSTRSLGFEQVNFLIDLNANPSWADHPNQLVLFESGEKKKAMVANRPRFFFK
jgi:hypothetical protein